MATRSTPQHSNTHTPERSSARNHGENCTDIIPQRADDGATDSEKEEASELEVDDNASAEGGSDVDALYSKLRNASAALPSDALQALMKNSSAVTRLSRELDKAKDIAALDAAVSNYLHDLDDFARTPRCGRERHEC